ncbi:MAG: hypothetical protein AABW51_05170 [Nanoarchaeota archaeon]
MNSKEKSKIARELENTLLSGAEIKGRTLVRRCCGKRMVKLNPNNGKRETLLYCSAKCHRSYNPSLANFFDPGYAVSGFK